MKTWVRLKQIPLKESIYIVQVFLARQPFNVSLRLTHTANLGLTSYVGLNRV